MPLLLCACMDCIAWNLLDSVERRGVAIYFHVHVGSDVTLYCNTVLIWCTLFQSVQSVSCFSTSEQGASTKQCQQTLCPDLSPSFSHYLSPHLCSPPTCGWPSSMLSCKFQLKACFSMAEAFFFSVCPTHFQLCSGSECHWFPFIMSLKFISDIACQNLWNISQGTYLYMSAAPLWFAL